MTPTPKLRFIERNEPMPPYYKTVDATGNLVQAVKTFRILQQWWAVERAGQITPTGEWRDVPIEKEQT